MRRYASAPIAGLAVLALMAGAAQAQSAASSQSLVNGVGGVGAAGAPKSPQAVGVTPNNPMATLNGVAGAGTDPAGTLGGALSLTALGGSTAENGIPVPDEANPEGYGLTPVGGALVKAGDLALRSRGHQGGLAGQGVDTGMITTPLTFKDTMPAASAAQVSTAMGMVNGLLGVN